MIFGIIANACTLFALYRIPGLGFYVGPWWWPNRDFRLYSAYWKIAPTKGWSRLSLIGAVLASVIAAIFLLCVGLGNH
jgi:hypothetical protein